MIDLRIKLSRSPISYDEFSGMVESLRSWDFVSDVLLLPDSCQLQPTQQEPMGQVQKTESIPIENGTESLDATEGDTL